MIIDHSAGKWYTIIERLLNLPRHYDYLDTYLNNIFDKGKM